MALKIENDHARFKELVRGKIRKDLRKFISKGELIGKQGKDLISIPIPQINIPKFRYGSQKKGGVGQGQGKDGQPVAQGDEGQFGLGAGGNLPGQHILEVDISLEELAQILADELELPNIKPKGEKNIVHVRDKYSSIRSTGPESLRHFKKTFRHALKRHIASGTYNPSNPMIVPIREDKRYRSWKEVRKPDRNAVIIYMMDVSGSMGDVQKEIVRITSFWLDTWLRSQYKGLESRYIIHDAVAREVDQDTFYRTRESGGTIISSAYKLCLNIMEKNYPSSEWNIYPFHFSDGDNWSGNDTNECVKLLKEQLLPQVNQFSYGQVHSEYGSGQFLKDLQDQFPEEKIMSLTRINGKDNIMDALKEFLGKGQ